MDISIYEDPACLWCWAFEPVATRLVFELGHVVRVRHVMGGLRDREVVDEGFAAQLWRTAAEVSGMPYRDDVGEGRSLRSTYPACKAVIAASILGPGASARLLRRLREAYFVEGLPIDDLNLILDLAVELGWEREALLESIASGRADAIFARERLEASLQGFGFPTLVVRSDRERTPALLQGVVPYGELLEALAALGLDLESRRQFRGSAPDWHRLFRIHPRLAPAEMLSVTGMRPVLLSERLASIGIEERGGFFQLRDPNARLPLEAERLVAALESELRVRKDEELADLDADVSPEGEGISAERPRARLGLP